MILFVSSVGTSIGKKSETITLNKNGEMVKAVSIRDIEGVIITTKAHVSYDALMMLSEWSIPVIYQRTGKIVSYVAPFINHGFVLTRRSQLNAYNDARGAYVAKQIVIGILTNKYRMLKYLAKNRKKSNSELADRIEKAATNISNSIEKVKILTIPLRQPSKGNLPPVEMIRHELLGYEGEGARQYFAVLSLLINEKFGFSGRNRRPPKDPVNSMLSYGYTILQGYVLAAISICGLEPYAGFLHSDRSGKPSLILDMMEEFRHPIIDRIILKLVNNNQIKPEDFTKEKGFIKMSDKTRRIFIDAIVQEMDRKTQVVNNQKMTYQQVIVHQSRQLVRFLLRKEGSYSSYKFAY